MSNRYQQTEARELAARHDTGACEESRRIREENIRRTRVANLGERRDVEFMRSIMSTPYAETRA